MKLLQKIEAEHGRRDQTREVRQVQFKTKHLPGNGDIVKNEGFPVFQINLGRIIFQQVLFEFRSLENRFFEGETARHGKERGRFENLHHSMWNCFFRSSKILAYAGSNPSRFCRRSNMLMTSSMTLRCP